MSDEPHPYRREPAPAVLTSGAGLPMSGAQAEQLKQLAIAAYEPDAFQEHLTQHDAGLRIAMLQAKLKLMDAPPHTL